MHLSMMGKEERFFCALLRWSVETKWPSSFIENATEGAGDSNEDVWKLPRSEIVKVPRSTLWMVELGMRG